jgi:hypothetical protein
MKTGDRSRNRAALPRGRSNVESEQQPGDEQVGGWTREERQWMDERFSSAMTRELQRRDPTK